jgi:hypothetical protein
MLFRFLLVSAVATVTLDAAHAAPDYMTPLTKLCDGLLATQNLVAGSKEYGALVCPSTNPDNHPTHSRGGEAVYPFAVVYKRTGNAKYADAAIKLGIWMFTHQNAAGAWGEDWPNYDGWDGTTADQLISLAGSYPMLKDRMTAAENTAWINSITRSANWIEANFPKGNLNYLPTGAVALKLASNVIANPPAKWNAKAASLMATTTSSVNNENFITGEGAGIDLGYNIAQSIGYITMYGILTDTKANIDFGAKVLRTHIKFMYPNGAIDNSWGTRSYKWTFESGTKTAPGIPFSFALLADQDPAFARGAQLSVDMLNSYIGDKNLEVYGPHASRHAGSNPPCIYSSFARAQSLATAVEYAPTAVAPGPIPSEGKNWSQYFATAKTALVRTDKIMATVTAYDGIGQYSRAEVVRGGSITALWFEGYSPLGFMQASSQSVYTREEDMHMPTEGALLPLTPRIEKTGGAFIANLFDEKAALAVVPEDGGSVKATATGALKGANGASSGVDFTWVHRFSQDSYASEVTVSSAQNVRIVEPFIDNAGNQYAIVGDSLFRITTSGGGVWEVKVTSSTGAFTLASGEDKAKYWSPFPGVECHPLTIKLGGTGSQTIKYTISQSKPVAIGGIGGRSGQSAWEAAGFRVRSTAGEAVEYEYALPAPADLRVALLGLDGSRIAEVTGRAAAGPGRGRLDAPGLRSGTYILELEANGRKAGSARLVRF